MELHAVGLAWDAGADGNRWDAVHILAWDAEGIKGDAAGLYSVCSSWMFGCIVSSTSTI